MHDADLGGGQADADRVVHQVAHPLDLLRAARRRTARSGARGCAAPGRRTGGSGRAPRARRAAVSGSSSASLASGSTPASGPSGPPRQAVSVGRIRTRFQLRASSNDSRAIGAHCGSTSTLTLTPRRPASAAHCVDRGADRAHRGLPVPALDHELAARAAAQPEQRRRPEHRLARSARSVPAGDTATATASDAVGRTSRRCGSATRTAGSRARGAARSSASTNPSRVVPGRERERARGRGQRLHEHPRPRRGWAAVSAAADPAGELSHESKRPLLGAEVREPERLVGVEHDPERHPVEVVALGHHLRFRQARRRRRPRTRPSVCASRSLPAATSASSRNTGSSPPNASSSSCSTLLLPAPWRATAARFALLAAAGNPAAVSAVMATAFPSPMEHERDLAVRAHPHVSATAAGEEVRPAAPVEQDDRLAAGCRTSASAIRVRGWRVWWTPRMSTTSTGGSGRRSIRSRSRSRRSATTLSGRGVALPASRIALCCSARRTATVRAS